MQKVKKMLKKNLFKILAFIILFVTVIVIIDSFIRAPLITISGNESKIIVTKIMNDAANEVLNDMNVTYSNLVNLKYNNDGYVVSLETNIVELNKLQASLSSKINDGISNLPNQDVSISLGTATGLQLLNGRGPNIHYKVYPYGNINTTLYSNFKSAGVNQTIHQIILSIEADVTSIIPLYSSNSKIVYNYIVAETIIVGNVPEGFTYITGDNRDVVPKINDYAS